MPKYRFKFNKKTVHLIIPHEADLNPLDITIMGIRELRKCGYYNEDDMKAIGNIPLGTAMNIFRQIP